MRDFVLAFRAKSVDCAAMDADEFTDAFLDSQYLRLTDGALAFIFTKPRVQAAQALSVAEANALLQKHHAQLVKIYGDTTRRILGDAYYMNLFEQLFELDDEVAFAFINLALRRVEDPQIEAARVQAVTEYQRKRKKPALPDMAAQNQSQTPEEGRGGT